MYGALQLAFMRGPAREPDPWRWPTREQHAAPLRNAQSLASQRWLTWRMLAARPASAMPASTSAQNRSRFKMSIAESMPVGSRSAAPSELAWLPTLSDRRPASLAPSPGACPNSTPRLGARSIDIGQGRPQGVVARTANQLDLGSLVVRSLDLRQSRADLLAALLERQSAVRT